MGESGDKEGEDVGEMVGARRVGEREGVVEGD